MSLRTNLVSYYELNETSGTTATDAHGSNDGTYNGDLPTFSDLIVGQGQDFDGTGDYVDLGTPAELNNIWDSGGAIAIVFNADSVSDADKIIGKRFNDSADAGWTLQVKDISGSDFELRLNVDFDGGAGAWDFSGFSTGNTYFIVLNYNSDSTSNDPTMYVNGSSVSPTELNTPSGTRIDDSGRDFILGARESTTAEYFDGKMAALAIYSSTQTEQSVKELYNNGIGRDYATTEFDGTNWDGHELTTFDNTKADEAVEYNAIDLTALEAAGKLSSGFWSSAQEDGSDIRVTNSAGDLAYPFELENFSASGKTGVIHFHSLGMSTSSDTDYRVYAGNTGATAPAEGDPLGSHAVFEEDIIGAYLMDVASGNLTDSSRNSNDMTANGDSTYEQSGQLGLAIDFDGTGDYFKLTHNQDYTEFTALAIINPDSVSTNGSGIVGAESPNANNDSTPLTQHNSHGRVFIRDNDNDIADTGTGSGTTLSNGTWYLLHGVGSASKANEAELYLNGSSDATGSNDSYDEFDAGNLYIGRDADSGEGGEEQDFDGQINLVILYKRSVSDNEASTQNNILMDNANCWSVTSNFGTNVTVSPGVNTATFNQPAPTVNLDFTVNTNTNTATFNQPAPSINVDFTVSVNTNTATFSQPAETVNVDFTVSANVNTATFNQPEESISAGVTVSANTNTGTFNEQSPTITVQTKVSPNVNTATFSQPAETTSFDFTVSPNVNTGTFNTGEPTIDTEIQITIMPNANTATFNSQSPDVIPEIVVSPNVNTSTFNQQGITVTGGSLAEPNALSATFNEIAPSISASATISLNANTATFTIEDPTVTGGATVSLTVNTATWNVIGVSVSGGASVDLNANSATFNILDETIPNIAVIPDPQIITLNMQDPTIKPNKTTTTRSHMEDNVLTTKDDRHVL